MTNNNVSISHKVRLMEEIIKDISPAIYKACEDAVKPRVTDLNLMPVICDCIASIKGKATNESMAFYCAVILKLYCPIQLYYKGERAPNGLRTKFCQIFGYKDTPIWNYWSDPVIPHMKNKRFASAVNECAAEVIQYLKTNGDLQGNIPCEAPFPRPFEKSEISKTQNSVDFSEIGDKYAVLKSTLETEVNNGHYDDCPHIEGIN